MHYNFKELVEITNPNTDPQTKMHNNITALQYLSEHPEEKQTFFLTCIRRRGCWDQIQFMLNYHLIDKNSRDPSNGNSILIYAAQRCSDPADPKAIKALQYLVQIGADVNLINNAGDNALMWPAYQGNIAACELLIEADIDITHTTPTHITALYAAVHGDQPSVVQELLTFKKLRGTLFQAAGNTENIIHFAAKRERWQCLNKLTTYFSIDARNEKNMTPLMCVMKKGNMAAALQLLELGANPYAIVEKNALNPIQRLIQKEVHLDLAWTVVRAHRKNDKNIDFGQQNDPKDIPSKVKLAVWALETDDFTSSSKILNNLGAQANTFLCLALLFAADAATLKTTKKILSMLKVALHGKHSNNNKIKHIATTNSVGDTPLHFAAAGYDINMAIQFISVGADYFQKNNLGYSPALVYFNTAPETALKLYKHYQSQLKGHERAQARLKLKALKEDPLLAEHQFNAVSKCIDDFFSNTPGFGNGVSSPVPTALAMTKVGVYERGRKPFAQRPVRQNVASIHEGIIVTEQKKISPGLSPTHDELPLRAKSPILYK